MTPSPAHPLEGVLILSLEQAVAAPFATRQLADLGARVIKVERVGEGDFCRGYDDAVGGLASYFVWLNRTKESLTLDVKAGEGLAILEELLARADVFVTNLSHDAVARLGLAHEQLTARHPHLITCSVTGYDAHGPEAARRAYDLLVQAEAGAVAVTGSTAEAAKVGISIADIAAGMYAYSAILAALYVRERHGVAPPIEVNLFDALTEWMAQPLYVAAGRGSDPQRRGLHHASIAPYGPVRTADGAVVIVAVQNPAEWRRFCEIVLAAPVLAEDERFASNVARVAHRDALEAEIAAVAGALDGEAFAARLQAADVPFAALRTPLEALAALRARLGSLPVVASEAGPVEIFGRPFTLGDSELSLGPVPALGAHTAAILAELGYPPERVAALRAAGVV
ncbi:MAG TPA: CaiB/BaiF CoA-transferase family protein [Acidimicrobiales bacterium]|nr:CaiB/BaiF CoA-transferase family protein [Acidimicrobiales bacterium]